MYFANQINCKSLAKHILIFKADEILPPLSCCKIQSQVKSKINQTNMISKHCITAIFCYVCRDVPCRSLIRQAFILLCLWRVATTLLRWQQPLLDRSHSPLLTQESSRPGLKSSFMNLWEQN